MNDNLRVENRVSDRRKNNVPVSIERRTGIDRREQYKKQQSFKSDMPVDSLVLSSDKRILDRRTQDIMVDFDRRSGVDRRQMQFDTGDIIVAAEVIPPVKRFEDIKEEIKEKDYISAITLAGVAIASSTSEGKDIADSCKQVKSLVTHTKYVPDSYYKVSQPPFSFFRGTLLDRGLRLLYKLNPKAAKKIVQYDKTLAETKLGAYLLKKMNVEEIGLAPTKIKDYAGDKVWATIYKGPKFAQIAAMAMNRIPILAVYLLGILELPNIIRTYNNAKTSREKLQNVSQQALNSTAKIGLEVSLSALTGAFGSKKAGPIGSLLGMGAGAVLGNLISKKIQNKISKK